jgi:hypothetical protein
MRKSVGKAPTAGEQTQQKPCRTSSDIGTELKYTVGRGPAVLKEKNLKKKKEYNLRYLLAKVRTT